MNGLLALDVGLALLALATALALRPWRVLPAGGPPWPGLACAALLPALWSADRLVAVPLAQPLSGACLLVLLMGWPLAVLALAGVGVVLALTGDLDTALVLRRVVWLGLVPGTLALALGMALRRWLPHHLFVYILGRAFLGTALCTALAGVVSALLHGAPAGVAEADLMLARFLAAWGDAFLCGMIVAIFVAFRPQWLATYADRLYLPPKPRDP